MKRNVKGKLICLLILFVAAVFVGADLPASAQNTNSGTTGDSMTQNTNTGEASANTGRRARRRQRRRARRRARRNANVTTPVEAPADANANTDTTGATTPTTGDTTGGTQTGGGGSLPGMGTFGDVADLSGTYTGTINYPEGGMTGEATLTLTGNTFTITAGSATVNGTYSARSWPGYTALSMRFGDTLPATIVSTRAWHRGRTLRIQSVRGESRPFSFNGRGDAAGGGGGADPSAGAATGGTRSRARGRRSRGRRGGATTGTTTTTTPDATPTPPPTL
ncbi:MAG TPA: hypothetical protein VGW12_16955 [Pyrinomonadaceae bacterium]|nr:hypothetical protein [Pyrinomonadaceae bacterium]